MFLVGMLVGAAAMLATLMIIGSIDRETSYTAEVDGKQYAADLEKIGERQERFMDRFKKQ